MNTYAHVFEVPTVLIGGITLNGVVALMLFGLLFMAFLSMRGSGVWYRTAALVSLLTVALFMFVGITEQLSHAKKLSLFWLKNQGEKGLMVHSTVVRPKERIFLWVYFDGAPRSFWVPWSQKLEDNLREAQKQSAQGRAGMLRFRFQPSLEQEPQFYTMPWPSAPQKDEDPGSNTLHYKREDA